MIHFKSIMGWIILTTITLFLYGCGTSSNNVKHVTLGPGCNPISIDDCFLPYPSFYYLLSEKRSFL